MPWYSALVGEPFLKWLRLAADEQYTPQVKGDPFATSMRDFDDVSLNLKSIVEGVPAQRQRMTDLRAAKIVASEGDTLSDLGRTVYNEWLNSGVADDDYSHELPRQLILVCEALAIKEPFYIGLAKFWRDKASQYGVDALVERWSDLFVQTHFSKSLGGYNPMAHVGPLELLPSWNSQEIRAAVTSMVTPSDKALVGLDRIITVLDGSLSRGKARKIFIAALCLAAEPSQTFAQGKLAIWTLPLTSTTSATSHSLLPDSVREICFNILSHYEVRLREAQLNLQVPQNLELLLKRKNVILFGPPGTGKTYGAHQIADYWKGVHGSSSVISTTFHPTYSYEDFVWGWRPDSDDPNKFVGQNGALLEACMIASGGTPTLLFIDEINRADTARVFGELITYIEADKRERPFRIAQDSKNDRMIPNNLFIIGTMNTADRSVSLLDVALRRRFAFVEYAPDPSIFSKHEKWAHIVSDVDIEKLMIGLNLRLLDVGVESDRAIGHALLSVSSDSDTALLELRDRVQYDIYPLVLDYCFSDRSRVAQVLGDLVSVDGRLKTLDDVQFVTALRGISG
jgi:hypothetical protein